MKNVLWNRFWRDFGPELQFLNIRSSNVVLLFLLRETVILWMSLSALSPLRNR